MKKLWLFLSAMAFVLVSCQDASRIELLKDEKVAVAPRWFGIATLRVQNVDDRTSEVHVGTVGHQVGESVECRFIEEESKGEKWAPLPIKIFTLSDPQKKLNAALASAMSFSDIKKSASLFEFVVKFEKGDIKFSSFWKLTPLKITHRDGSTKCSAKPEICLGTDKKACEKNWKWLKEIIAVPSITAYLTGGGEVVTDLQGVFWELRNGEYVASEPVSIL